MDAIKEQHKEANTLEVLNQVIEETLPYKKMKLVDSDGKTSSLNQAYSSGMEFTIIGKGNKMALPWAFCKDYMTDLFWASNGGHSSNIYGCWINDSNHVRFTNIKLGIKLKKSEPKDLLNKVQSSIDLINGLFNEFGKFRRLSIYRISQINDKEIAVIVKIPKAYLIAPPVLSLITLLFRVGVNYDTTKESSIDYLKNIGVKKIKPGDASMISNSMPIIEYLRSNGNFEKLFPKKDLHRNWAPWASINTMHNGSGISSYSRFFKPDVPFYEVFEKVNHGTYKPIVKESKEEKTIMVQ